MLRAPASGSLMKLLNKKHQFPRVSPAPHARAQHPTLPLPILALCLQSPRQSLPFTTALTAQAVKTQAETKISCESAPNALVNLGLALPLHFVIPD